MKYQTIIALGLVASASAFPGMRREDFLNYLGDEIRAREANGEAPTAEPLDKRATTLGKAVTKLSGPRDATNISSSDLRPQKGYPFKAPTTGEARGPCPGMNLLANHGYLPRNGYVTFDQVVAASVQGFNMGEDLATALATLAVLTDGDIATESFWIGTNPSTSIGGLNRHSTFESDISPMKEDFYLACGDNHHLSSRKFAQAVEIVAASASLEFDLTNMGSQYAMSANFSRTYNQYLYFAPPPMLAALATHAIYPALFANGTLGEGGVANYESIASIVGAKWVSGKQAFEYVPERFPPKWYRRSTPWDSETAITEAFTSIYLRDPIFPGISTFGTSSFDYATVICDLYAAVNSVTPYALAGQADEIAAGILWGLSKLDAYWDSTTLGCVTAASSDEFSPWYNASVEGGPLNEPSSSATWTGNNVYHSIYFAAAPTAVACEHAEAA